MKAMKAAMKAASGSRKKGSMKGSRMKGSKTHEGSMKCSRMNGRFKQGSMKGSTKASMKGSMKGVSKKGSMKGKGILQKKPAAQQLREPARPAPLFSHRRKDGLRKLTTDEYWRLVTKGLRGQNVEPNSMVTAFEICGPSPGP